MKKKSTLKKSRTDWDRIDNLREKDIDLTDIPEITKDMAKKAVLRVGGEHVPKSKVRVNILLDANVVSYFKAKAGGRGYQTLINETLREGINNVHLESILRRIIREELAPR